MSANYRSESHWHRREQRVSCCCSVICLRMQSGTNWNVACMTGCRIRRYQDGMKGGVSREFLVGLRALAVFCRCCATVAASLAGSLEVKADRPSRNGSQSWPLCRVGHTINLTECQMNRLANILEQHRAAPQILHTSICYRMHPGNKTSKFCIAGLNSTVIIPSDARLPQRNDAKYTSRSTDSSLKSKYTRRHAMRGCSVRTCSA